MKTKELDTKTYNDLLQQAARYVLAKDKIKHLIEANTSLINYYREHHFDKLANELLLKNNGVKCALSSMKSAEDVENYGDYTVIAQDNFDRLMDKAIKMDNFIETLDKAIVLKYEHLKLYRAVGCEEFVCKLRYEYQAMQYIRHILSNIMEGETNASVK